MKKLARHIVSAVQTALVLLMITALMVSVVSSAQRHNLLDEQLVEQADAAHHAQLVQGPPDPEEISKSMTPSQRPHTEQSAHTIQSVSSSKNGGDDHLKLSNSHTAAFAAFRSDESGPKAARTSPALISTELGTRFTLVGAHPDGTS